MLENKTFELMSGKQLVVSCANFDTQIQLCQALINTVKESGLSFTADLLQTSFENIFQSPIVATSLAKAFLAALTNKEIANIFWECAIKCTYDGLKIDRKLFSDDIKARADYFQIQFIVLRENVSPFFPNLLTELKPQGVS